MAQSDSVPTVEPAAVRESLSTGRGLHLAFQAGLDWLKANREAIDRLNVFPVPDGDTGTNMVLTLEAALEEIRKVPSRSVSDVARAAARGCLLGARGNSGVILSQIVSGMSKGLDGLTEFTSPQFAESLRLAYQVAYDAVSKPVEGTILTVARHTGTAAVDAAGQGASVESVLAAAVESAARSVEDTPNRLEVLKEAGVVDAGGQGLYIILEGFLKYCRGEEIDADASIERAEDVFAAFALDHSGDEHGFCTQFLIQGEELDLATARSDLESMTDWAIIVGDGDLIRVHVHTERPGDILNYAVDLGDVNRISIDNMDLQQAEHFAAALDTAPPVAVAKADVVAVAAGPGFQEIFESLGVRVVLGGQTMNPSAAEILEAIDGCGGPEVVVLPNNSNIVMTARQAASSSSKSVHVIETVTVPHGIAAALAYSPAAGLEANRSNMTEAAGSVTVIEVTKAIRDSEIGGVMAREGEFIGLVDGSLKAAGETIGDVMAGLFVTFPDSDFDLATVYRGETATSGNDEQVSAAIEIIHPDVDIEFVAGGQAHYDYIISLE